MHRASLKSLPLLGESAYSASHVGARPPAVEESGKPWPATVCPPSPAAALRVSGTPQGTRGSPGWFVQTLGLCRDSARGRGVSGAFPGAGLLRSNSTLIVPLPTNVTSLLNSHTVEAPGKDLHEQQNNSSWVIRHIYRQKSGTKFLSSK